MSVLSKAGVKERLLSWRKARSTEQKEFDVARSDFQKAVVHARDLIRQLQPPDLSARMQTHYLTQLDQLELAPKQTSDDFTRAQKQVEQQLKTLQSARPEAYKKAEEDAKATEQAREGFLQAVRRVEHVLHELVSNGSLTAQQLKPYQGMLDRETRAIRGTLQDYRDGEQNVQGILSTINQVTSQVVK